MSEVDTFEHNLDVVIAQLRVHNITGDVASNRLICDDFLSTIADHVSNLQAPREAPTTSKYIKLLTKSLSLAEPLIRLIPYVGGILAGGVKTLVEYLSPNNLDITEIVSEEIRDTFHNERIDKANGIIKSLHFSLIQMQSLTNNSQGTDPALVHKFIAESVRETVRFLGEMESKIRRESKGADRNIAVSDATRLLLFIEVYCYFNLVVLLHFLAFKMYLPGQKIHFDLAFNDQKETFDQTIQFLAEDNPIVSCYFPSRFFAIKKSLKYFGRKIQSIEEIHNKDFCLFDNPTYGYNLKIDCFFPRLISVQDSVFENNVPSCCFIFRKQTSDNIYKMFVKTISLSSDLCTCQCYFKNNTVHVGIPGGDDTCRLTRVSAGKYMISSISTCKPYRMKAPIGNIFKPLPLAAIIHNKVYFYFYKYRGELKKDEPLLNRIFTEPNSSNNLYCGALHALSEV